MDEESLRAVMKCSGALALSVLGACALPSSGSGADDGNRSEGGVGVIVEDDAMGVPQPGGEGGTDEDVCRCPVVTDHATWACEEGSDACTILVCRGERYDVDGRLDNGCEAQDTPRHDTLETAVEVDLPDARPVNVDAPILSDDRAHDTEPVKRELGLPDWWKVTAIGNGNLGKTMHACLYVGDLPVDSVYEVCISEAGSERPSVCKTVAPTTPEGLSRCAVAADDSGIFFVRVLKKAGAHSARTYALYLEH